jgi:hypothetical protein
LRLVAGGWFVLREKYCWLVADKPSEQAVVFPSRLFPRDWLGREIYLVLYPSSAMCCFKKTQKLCVSSTPWENLNPSDFVKKLLNEKCTV